MLAALLLYQSLTTDLDAILDAPQLKGAIVAAHVTTLEGQVVYSKNGDTRVMPASNQKLLTCAYAMSRHSTAETLFWKEPDRIVVFTTGDPMLTHKQLVDARERLKITEKLPIYLMQPYAPGIPPGWEQDDLPNKYAAPITAFTVDRGSFELWAEDGKLLFLPESYGTRIMHLESGSSVRVTYNPDARFVFVQGPLPKARTRLDTLALPQPDRAAASILGGPLMRATGLPARAPDYVLRGDWPFAECLTKSDNNIAEHLLLKAAVIDGPLTDRPYDVAPRRLKEFLVEKVGVDPQDVNPSDGSGLSRHNNVTARALCKVLVWARYKPRWTESLAKAGEGTLEGRLEGSTFIGKTGSLDLSNALSGYVQTKDGKSLVVSLIFNHYLGSAADIRGIQNRFIRRLEAGTQFAWTVHHESNPAHAQHRPPDRNRTHRHDHDGLVARSGADCGDEPAHARLPDDKRVAVRSR